MWDGKDEAGLPLPDGTYAYQMVVVDADGHSMNSDRHEVIISTQGPQGRVPVVVEP
jgi:flagellar hook assembly protein FlgD